MARTPNAVKPKSFGAFAVIWLGQWISNIGSGLTAFGLGVHMFQRTGSATAVSLIALCAFLPMIVLGPAAGVLADRFDRRLLMIIGDGGSAVGLVYILAIMLTGEPTLAQICIGAAFSSIFASLTDPAYKATITDLLDPDQFAQASGLVQLAGASKYLLSPFLAGILLGVMDVSWLLVMDIATFGVTVVTVLLIRGRLASAAARPGSRTAKAGANGPARRTGSWWRWLALELKDGWRMLSQVQGVVHLTVLLTLLTFCVGFLETLFAPMVLPLADPATLGIIESVSAAGLLATSLLIGVTGIGGSYTRTLSLGLLAVGLFFSLTGVSTNLYAIAAAGFCFFAALPYVNASADFLIRTNIPDEAQGRAWGIIGFVTQLGYAGAYASAGLLADRLFDPMLAEGGSLSASVGAVIGTGPGRGIGLLLILFGLLVAALALPAGRLRAIRSLAQRASELAAARSPITSKEETNVSPTH